jgi:ribosomal protein S18 acetylase RimI-like enzyme
MQSERLVIESHHVPVATMTQPILRSATPGDATDIALLILLSAEHFLPAVFGPRIEAGLSRLVAREGILFSSAHASIADAEGRVVGMLLGYSGREKAKEDPATGLGLLGVLGGDMLCRLGRLLRVQRTIGTIAANEWYVSNVAVLPALRGQGIGRALLLKAEERARDEGAAAIVLDVETDNPSAIRVYAGLGYTTASATPFLMLDGRAFAFFRMRKQLARSI